MDKNKKLIKIMIILQTFLFCFFLLRMCLCVCLFRLAIFFNKLESKKKMHMICIFFPKLLLSIIFGAVVLIIVAIAFVRLQCEM